MPISRTRSTQHKVYIPSSARGNQYLMVKFPLTDELIAKYADLIDERSSKPYEKFYQKLASIFFDINNELDIENCKFVANDKFTRVRFSPEQLTSETKQQLLFLYNPNFHTSQSSYFDGSYRAKKLTLVFLAKSADVRTNSANFHKQVTKSVETFTDQLNVEKSSIRVCDHQHLTYDLFAKSKGVEGTQVHKVRSITKRYSVDDVNLPEDIDALTYAVVDLPINKRIRSLVELNSSENDQYSELYNLIADAFISSAKKQNLNSGAVIANGLVPIVRNAEDENVIASGELLMLGYNPTHTSCGYTCKWDSAKLVDTVQLIFVASVHDKTSNGHGRFVNHVEQSLRSFANRLEFIPEQEELTVRLHQHIGYNLV